MYKKILPFVVFFLYIIPIMEKSYYFCGAFNIEGNLKFIFMSNKSINSKKLLRFERFVDEVCKQVIGCEQFEIHSIDDCYKLGDLILTVIKKSKTYKMISFCTPTDPEVKRLIVHSLQHYYLMQDFYYNNLPF